jgi:hypothetical protein
VGVLEPLLLGVPEHVLDLGRDVPPCAVRPVLGEVDDARELLDEVAVLGLGLGLVLDEGFVADADLLFIAREPVFQELGRAGCCGRRIHPPSASVGTRSGLTGGRLLSHTAREAGVSRVDPAG